MYARTCCFLNRGRGMVPLEGVEPTHSYEYQILSLARLPIPPHRLSAQNISDLQGKQRRKHRDPASSTQPRQIPFLGATELLRVLNVRPAKRFVSLGHRKTSTSFPAPAVFDLLDRRLHLQHRQLDGERRPKLGHYLSDRRQSPPGT